MTWRRETPYNFIGTFDNVLHAFKESLDYAVNLKNTVGFLLFYVTAIIGGVGIVPVSFILFNALHGIDLFFHTILEKTVKGMDEDRPHIVQFISVLTALTFILPVIIFYTPAIIYTKVIEKRDALFRRVDEERLEQVREDLNRWGPPPPRRTRRDDVKEHKDFKPKKNIKAHNFRKGKVIIPGVYVGEGERVVIHTHTTRRRPTRRDRIEGREYYREIE